MRKTGWALLVTLVLAPSAARAGNAGVAEECASTAERAQGARQSRKLRAAREDLIQCARAACPAIVRRDCVTWLGEVEAALPTIVLRAHGERGEDLLDVTVEIDGARVAEKLDGAPLPLDPGPHVVRFTAPGMKPVAVDVVLAEGDKARPVVGELRPVEAARTDRNSIPSALPWVAFGVGALSLGAFAALEIVGHGQLSDLEASCGVQRTCRDDQVAPVRTKFRAAAATLGIGLAGAAAGGVLLALRNRDRAPARAWIRAAPLTGGAGFIAGATF